MSRAKKEPAGIPAKISNIKNFLNFKKNKTIEPGVPYEHDVVLTGESDEGPNIIAGDLVARIKIKPHNTFKRKGADLRMVK